MAAYSASLEDVKTAVLGLLVILQVGLHSSGSGCAVSFGVLVFRDTSGELGTPWGLKRAAWV